MGAVEHCRHCVDPADPRHQDPAYAKAEADCVFYEHPEHRLVLAGSGRKHPKDELIRFLTVRLSPSMLGQVRVAAAEEGCTVGSWVRQAIRSALWQRAGRDQG